MTPALLSPCLASQPLALAASPLWSFSSYSAHHLVLTLGCVWVTWIVIRYARTVRGTPSERHVRAAWAFMTLGGELGSTIIWALPVRYARDVSWPLHLCDYAAWLAVVAMLSPYRWPRTLLFFWGLGLSTQGFFTPTVETGLLSAEYWVFWVQHLGVVGGAVYLAAVNRYRPTVRDLAFTIGATLVLVAFMVWLNREAGTNYMYLGDQLPDTPTLLDVLGPYPGRIGWIVLLGVVGFSLTYLGSEVIHRLAGSCGQKPTGPESGH